MYREVMIFRSTGLIFCAISHTQAGDYRLTIEYSIPPFDIVGSVQTVGSGTLVDLGTGVPTLTIGLNDADVVYFGGIISGSFSDISIAYTGTTGQISGNWNVPNAFNPATFGSVIMPLTDGEATDSWDQIAPLTGGESDAVFQDPNGELKIKGWTIEDLDGPENPAIDQPYLQFNSSVNYEIDGWPIFDGPLPTSSVFEYEYPSGYSGWSEQGFSWFGWNADGCQFEANEGSESYEYFDGYGGSINAQYFSSLTFQVAFVATEDLIWSTTGNYGYELKNLSSSVNTSGILSDLNGGVLSPGIYSLRLFDGNFGESYEWVDQYGCGWNCQQCDCTDCCPEEIYQESGQGYLVNGSYTLEPAPAACLADINSDGSVGFPDLVQLISKWGNCPDCPEDINSDGEVNFTDLLQITSTWGPC